MQGTSHTRPGYAIDAIATHAIWERRCSALEHGYPGVAM